MYERITSPTLTSERLFPIYQRSHDAAADTTTVNVVGWDPVSLFRYHATSTTSSHHLIPLYGYHQDGDSTETSVLGLPALSLYHTLDTPIESRNRLFPLYRYTRDYQQDEQSLAVLWLFWHTNSPTKSQTSLFPLGSVASEQTGDREVALLGLDPLIPVSWIRHSHGPDRARGFFAPFYDYQRNGDDSSLSIGGISALALYRNEHTSTADLHRLFPLYRYHHDLTNDGMSMNALLLYQQEQSPSHATYTLFPLWQYERRNDRDESRFNALGIGRFSLYAHDREPGRATDRFFPLYQYASDENSGNAEFALLWPLAEYKSRHGIMTSASLLWWLVAYDRSDEAHSNFHIMGGSKMAMIRRVISPETSIFEINPVFPFYRYRSETEGGTSWDFLYGLVGAESTRERTRVKLLWVISI
ncbi:MAG: hypothetical protein HP491_08930 [Nitrospira sp.]|nr:hypothetical protein [Nitrospira sp.]